MRLQRFFAQIAKAVADLPTREESLVEGFALAVHTLRTEPLVTRLLRTEPEMILPFLTVHGGLAVTAVRSFFAEQLRAAAPQAEPGAERDLDTAAELVTRLGLSFLLIPASTVDLDHTTNSARSPAVTSYHSSTDKPTPTCRMNTSNVADDVVQFTPVRTAELHDVEHHRFDVAVLGSRW